MEDTNEFIHLALVHVLEQLGGHVSLDRELFLKKLKSTENFKHIAVSMYDGIIRLELVDEDKNQETA